MSSHLIDKINNYHCVSIKTHQQINYTIYSCIFIMTTIFCFVILLIIKPRCIMYKKEDGNHKINVLNLICYSLITGILLSTLIILIMYFYS
jgi:hypothetical protein